MCVWGGGGGGGVNLGIVVCEVFYLEIINNN